MRFSDNLIANIAKTLQIGILTGTDIVDHLRTFTLEDNDGYLSLTQESKARIEKEIKEMLDNIDSKNNIKN